MHFRFIFYLISRSRIVIYTVLLAAALIGTGCSKKEEAVFIRADTGEGASAEEAVPVRREEDESYSVIGVFVCGAVNCEGVYELPKGSRVIDAVNAAGGDRDDADRTYINQAEYVSDTEKIEIPTIEETQILRAAENGPDAGAGEADNNKDSSGLVNINTAGREELMTLPGIGESKASGIIKYRESHGPFGNKEEIMNVSGIGSSVYEKLEDCISVE